MSTKRKIWLAGASLTVIAALAAVPAMRGLAAEPEPDAGPATCTAMADELKTTATGIADRLVAVPPDLSGVSELVNELLGLGTGLVDLGCLPAPELPVAAPVDTDHAPAQVPPIPTLPVDPGLPAVPACTDLTADLLAAITGTLAALLSADLPDLTGALDPLTGLTDTLTGITGESCLPAAS